MDKYLYVKGVGGLGNRLQSLCVAIDYAKKSNRKLFVDWRDQMFSTDGSNIFTKYFDVEGLELLSSDEGLNAINGQDVYPSSFAGRLETSVYQLFKQKPFHRIYPVDIWIPVEQNFPNNLLTQLLFRLQMTLGVANEHMICGSFLPENLPHKLVVFTDYEPLFSTETLQKSLILKGELGREVEKFVQREFESSAVVGVHVRNTDRKPLGSFDKLFAAIHEKMAEHQKIFLASDDAGIKGRFDEEFGAEKVISTEKFVPEIQDGGGIHHWSNRNQENKAEQIFRESVIDLWLLSQTDYLFYQGNSSFSRIAWARKGEKGGEDWNQLV